MINNERHTFPSLNVRSVSQFLVSAFYKLCYMHKGRDNVHPRTGHKDLEGE